MSTQTKAGDAGQAAALPEATVNREQRLRTLVCRTGDRVRHEALVLVDAAQNLATCHAVLEAFWLHGDSHPDFEAEMKRAYPAFRAPMHTGREDACGLDVISSLLRVASMLMCDISDRCEEEVRGER